MTVQLGMAISVHLLQVPLRSLTALLRGFLSGGDEARFLSNASRMLLVWHEAQKLACEACFAVVECCEGKLGTTGEVHIPSFN
jgi:hypothetical protein